MTNQNQIRQAFLQHSCRPYGQTGKRTWLIKGDFDHFKLMNDLYGSLISDYLLDWTLEVIESELVSHQKEWGSENVLWNFVGDDITIYIPPSRLQEEDVEQMLWKICDSIAVSFSRPYRVAAIPLSSAFFEAVPAYSQERLRHDLEKMDVVLDFARRQRGYLVVLPVGTDGRYGQIFNRVLYVIQNRLGRSIPSLELQSDWICDPDLLSYSTFNEGFLQPPSVSFAACSIRMDGRSVPFDRRSMYERFSLACQAALRVCKQQQKQVLIQKEGTISLDLQPAYQPAGVLALYSPLRWSSERYLRETLYFHQLDQPVLFQFNPVYHSNAGIFKSAMAEDISKVEKYRGNQYGIGLKGINEIFGQNAADCLICELSWVFSKVMQSALVEKGIPLTEVHIARFVDRFTVCCEQPVFQLHEILELVRRLARLFNCVSDEIKIAHLRISLVFGEDNSLGCRLFHQLALTGLSPRSISLKSSYPPIEMRHNRLPSASQEGSNTLERTASLSAQRLDSYSRVPPQRQHSWKLFKKTHWKIPCVSDSI